jgi:hypothetical protein
MTTTSFGAKAPENEIDFIATPEPAPRAFDTNKECGVKIISVCIDSGNSSCSKRMNLTPILYHSHLLSKMVFCQQMVQEGKVSPTWLF